MQVVPDSQSFETLDQIINYVEQGLNNRSTVVEDINYLLIGLRNTKDRGYKLVQYSNEKEF